VTGRDAARDGERDDVPDFRFGRMDKLDNRVREQDSVALRNGFWSPRVFAPLAAFRAASLFKSFSAVETSVGT